MRETFSLLLYDNHFLILKSSSDKPPFVIAEVHSESYATQIVNLLNQQEKNNETNSHR